MRANDELWVFCRKSNKQWKAVTLLAYILPLVVMVSLLVGQAGAQRVAEHPGLSHGPKDFSLEILDLSDEQAREVNRLQSQYLGRLQEHKNRLLNKRLELRASLRDPSGNDDTVRRLAREVSTLHSRCREILVDYLLELRKVLTDEQWRHWQQAPSWIGRPDPARQKP